MMKLTPINSPSTPQAAGGYAQGIDVMGVNGL
jgi:hypothetical protein